MNKPYMKIWRQVHYDKKDKPYYKGYFCSIESSPEEWRDFMLFGSDFPTKKQAVIMFRIALHRGWDKAMKCFSEQEKFMLTGKGRPVHSLNERIELPKTNYSYHNCRIKYEGKFIGIGGLGNTKAKAKKDCLKSILEKRDRFDSMIKSVLKLT